MSRSESLKEKIRQIEGKIRFFRNAILAIVSGLVWAAYHFAEGRSGKEILVFTGIGIVVLIYALIRVKSLETKEDWLIEELEKEE